jgi:hypothetical protein
MRFNKKLKELFSGKAYLKKKEEDKKAHSKTISINRFPKEISWRGGPNSLLVSRNLLMWENGDRMN